LMTTMTMTNGVSSRRHETARRGRERRRHDDAMRRARERAAARVGEGDARGDVARRRLSNGAASERDERWTSKVTQ